MKNTKKKALMGYVNYAIVIIAFIVFQILQNTGNLSRQLTGLLVPICAYVVMALALNLVVGISGELSLGHAGFMSVGAFSAAIVSAALQTSVPNDAVRLVISIVVAAVFAAIAGIIVGIPVLRLSGDYLAIVTLAFGEIIKNVINMLYVGIDDKGIHFSMESVDALKLGAAGKVVINGPQGATITKISTFISGVILILITLFIIQNLVKSRTGRAIMAIRDNRIAAESCGLNVVKYKMIAFVTSAALAGAAGALYALNYSTVAAKKFDFNTSILILVFVVLGGIGNLSGSIIAAAVLVALPELLREFNDYRMLVYAVVLILVMIISNNAKARAFLRSIFSKVKKTKEGEEN